MNGETLLTKSSQYEIINLKEIGLIIRPRVVFVSILYLLARVLKSGPLHWPSHPILQNDIKKIFRPCLGWNLVGAKGKVFKQHPLLFPAGFMPCGGGGASPKWQFWSCCPLVCCLLTTAPTLRHLIAIYVLQLCRMLFALTGTCCNLVLIVFHRNLFMAKLFSLLL